MIRLLACCLALACTRAGPVEDPLEDVPSGTLAARWLHLKGPATGSAALIVGPDGTSVLVDVGNDSHSDAVVGAVQALTGEAAVDWIVLTHLHEDHAGGLDDLLAAISVRQGLIWRGPVDIERGTVSGGTFADVCEARLTVPLCGAAVSAPCGLDPTTDAPWPAVTCAGLGEADARIDLGDGAKLEIVAANGHSVGVGGLGVELGYDDDGENARSLVGVLTYGDFGLVFGGDLTGGGKGTPDVESALAALADLWAPPGGADVLVLNHHGIRSSNNEAWLSALLPDDGRVRHAIVPSSGAYLAAPHQDVLDALVPRLAGGRVWMPDEGRLAGEHALSCASEGPVDLRVLDGGARWILDGGACGTAEVPAP